MVPPKEVKKIFEKIKNQKSNLNHPPHPPPPFDGKLQPLMETVTGYLDMRLANVR